MCLDCYVFILYIYIFYNIYIYIYIYIYYYSIYIIITLRVLALVTILYNVCYNHRDLAIYIERNFQFSSMAIAIIYIMCIVHCTMLLYSVMFAIMYKVNRTMLVGSGVYYIICTTYTLYIRTTR